MTVSPTTAVGAAATTTTTNTKSAASLTAGGDFTMFLKLLTTQMQNQDPLSPMDTSQYTQQLVQYSQVEQSVQQTGLLKDLLARFETQDMAQAAGFIGRDAEFSGADAGLAASAPANWIWSMPKQASQITARIVDARGVTVATPVVALGASADDLRWDGMRADGSRAAPGTYTLKIEAKDASGATVPVTIGTRGRIDEVRLVDGQLQLGVNGAALPLTALRRLTEAAD